MIIKKAIVNVNAIVSLLLVQGSAAGKAEEQPSPIFCRFHSFFWSANSRQ